MPNPFAFIEEIREMNIDLCERLDTIIEKLEELVQVTVERGNDFYGDGR